MLRVTLTIEGEIVIDRLLKGLEERASDLTPAWPAVVRAFREIVGRAFDTEGASTGAPWQPLAKRTVDERRRLGFGPEHPILQRTQNLQRALTIGEGAYVRTTPRSLEYMVAPHLGYFVYHQSNQPRTRLPRRAPVLLTMDDRHSLFRPIRLYLTGRDPDAQLREAFA